MTPRAPGPKDRVVLSGRITQLHPTHVMLGSRGVLLFFPEGASASDFHFSIGKIVTVTVARLGGRFFIEKVSNQEAENLF